MVKLFFNEFINEKKYSNHKFGWQEGYGAFSFSHSALDKVINYVVKQKEHHRNKTFKEEYLDFLMKYEVEFKNEYLFEWID